MKGSDPGADFYLGTREPLLPELLAYLAVFALFALCAGGLWALGRLANIAGEAIGGWLDQLLKAFSG